MRRGRRRRRRRWLHSEILLRRGGGGRKEAAVAAAADADGVAAAEGERRPWRTSPPLRGRRAQQRVRSRVRFGELRARGRAPGFGYGQEGQKGEAGQAEPEGEA